MKKYLLLLLSSFLFVAGAQALTTNQQMNAMKEIFLKEFSDMDKNKDGVISKSEYMSYQFENFRSNIIEFTGFEDVKTVQEKPVEKEKVTVIEKSKVELGGISPALQEMAEYSFEDNGAEVDLSISEEESLKDLLAEMEQTKEETPKIEAPQKSAEEIEARNKQINFMMDTIKKSLPKKIDEITMWTDILYENNTIAYVYQADIDTSKFSKEERKNLESSIKNEACVNAYKEMCPKIKSMFIDDGINMQIRYIDINNVELNYCDFNKVTCQ